MTTAPPLTAAQQGIADYIERLQLLRRAHRQPPGYAYQGMEDFLAQHGQWFDTPSPLAQRCPPGTPRRCFANAMALVAACDGLSYCEGLATRGSVLTFPVHHGWAVDAAGRVVDITWRDEWTDGTAYCGVAFPYRTALAALKRSGSVLDDWQRHWPIFRKPWPPRAAVKKVPRRTARASKVV